MDIKHDCGMELKEDIGKYEALKEKYQALII